MRIRMAAELEAISITAKGAGKLLQLIGKTPSFDINDLHKRRMGQTSLEKWADEQKRVSFFNLDLVFLQIFTIIFFWRLFCC